MKVIGFNSIFYWVLHIVGACHYKFSRKGIAVISVTNILLSLLIHVVIVVFPFTAKYEIQGSNITDQASSFISNNWSIFSLLTHCIMVYKYKSLGKVLIKVDKLSRFIPNSSIYVTHFHMPLKTLVILLTDSVLIIYGIYVSYALRLSLPRNLLYNFAFSFNTVSSLVHLCHYVQLLFFASNCLDVQNFQSLPIKVVKKSFFKVR